MVRFLPKIVDIFAMYLCYFLGLVNILSKIILALLQLDLLK